MPGTVASHEQCCEGLLQLIASKLPVKKRDLVCEVFSSPHCCHVPSSHRWDPPHCVLYPDGISPVLQETAKVSGWQDGCGSGVVAGGGEGSDPPQWAYCQLESGKAKPPLVSVSPTYTAHVCTKSYTYNKYSSYVCEDSPYCLTACLIVVWAECQRGEGHKLLKIHLVHEYFLLKWHRSKVYVSGCIGPL